MKREVYKEKVNTREELVARIMSSAAHKKQERQDDLRKAERTIAKRVEKCIEVDGGIFLTLTLNCCNLLRSFTWPMNAINKSFVFPSYVCKAFYA